MFAIYVKVICLNPLCFPISSVLLVIAHSFPLRLTQAGLCGDLIMEHPIFWSAFGFTTALDSEYDYWL